MNFDRWSISYQQFKISCGGSIYHDRNQQTLQMRVPSSPSSESLTLKIYQSATEFSLPVSQYGCAVHLAIDLNLELLSDLPVWGAMISQLDRIIFITERIFYPNS